MKILDEHTIIPDDEHFREAWELLDERERDGKPLRMAISIRSFRRLGVPPEGVVETIVGNLVEASKLIEDPVHRGAYLFWHLSRMTKWFYEPLTMEN